MSEAELELSAVSLLPKEAEALRNEKTKTKTKTKQKLQATLTAARARLGMLNYEVENLKYEILRQKNAITAIMQDIEHIESAEKK